tara:strand:+ start:337 stop:1464 length:1128 start_codon:yes stop_codon:yes gene_type:complete
MKKSEIQKLAGTKAPITRALNKAIAANKANEFDVIIESAKKLTEYAQRILDQWPQLKSATKPKKVKAKAPKVESPKVKAPKVKAKAKPNDIYKDEKKRENRIFVAQNFDAKIEPVKKALIMPAEGLEDIAQFFKLGLFDENTQLICVDQSAKVVKGWEENFGGKLRLALNNHRVFDLNVISKMIADMPEPVYIHGKIGAKEGEHWDVDLSGIDGIDFAWLDFTGHISEGITDWIEAVLKWKTSPFAMVNVTGMAEYKAIHDWAKPTLMNKRETVRFLMEENQIHQSEILAMMAALDNPDSMDAKNLDNILIRQALKFPNEGSHGIWVRRSQDHSIDAEALSENVDIASYRRKASGACRMVTHKFIRSQKGFLNET